MCLKKKSPLEDVLSSIFREKRKGEKEKHRTQDPMAETNGPGLVCVLLSEDSEAGVFRSLILS